MLEVAQKSWQKMGKNFRSGEHYLYIVVAFR